MTKKGKEKVTFSLNVKNFKQKPKAKKPSNKSKVKTPCSKPNNSNVKTPCNIGKIKHDCVAQYNHIKCEKLFPCLLHNSIIRCVPNFQNKMKKSPNNLPNTTFYPTGSMIRKGNKVYGLNINRTWKLLNRT